MELKIPAGKMRNPHQFNNDEVFIIIKANIFILTLVICVHECVHIVCSLNVIIFNIHSEKS